MKTLYTTYNNFAKRLVMSLMVLMTIGVNIVWVEEETWSHTFTNTENAGNKTWDNIAWTLSINGGTTSNYDNTKGAHYGTNSNTCNSVSFSSSGISGTITSIKIEASRGSSLVGNLSVSVGEEAYVLQSGESSLTTDNATYKFDGKSAGNILIKWTKTSGKGAFYIKSISVTYTSDSGETPGGGETPEPDPDPEEPSQEYTAILVTDIDDLKAGDQIIIVASNYDVALSTMQNTNNRGQATVTKEELEIAFDDKTQIITLEAGTIENTYAFNVGNGYLYAAGGSGDNGNNYLKTTPTLDSKGSWNISISNNVATIKSVEPTGTKARNWLRYNSTNTPPIFSCYASGQEDVSIYKYVSCSNEVTLRKGTASNAEITDFTASTYTCSDEEAERQVTITVEPNTGYVLNESSVSLSGSVSATLESFDVATGTYVYQFEKDASGEVTISVTATAKTTTISFNQNGGEGCQTENKTATYDQPMPTPITLPTSYSHNFTGYFDAVTGGTKYYNADGTSATTWNKEVAECTLYAQWTEKDLINYRTLCTYDIILKNNYTEDESKDGYTTITATHTSFSTTNKPAAREGYEIEGYYAESACTNKVADDKGKLIADVTNYTDANGKWIGSETTLYTKWIGREYTVTLDDNGGSGGSGTITATYGSPMPVITLPTRTGYTFNGYWTGKTIQSTQYYDENGNSLKNWDKDNNTTTLCALWTANTNTPYVVKHYKELLDGTYHPTEADNTDNLTGTTASSVTPEVKSYEGFTAPSTQTVSIAADGSTVVTYLYSRNSYNLSWNLAGGIITTEGTAQGSVKYEAPITAPTVAKTGYNFISWSPEVPETMPAANVTCTAQWTANTYTITLDQQEATTPGTTTVEATYGSALPSIAENLPTKTGYDFGGYYTEINGNGTQYYHGTGNGARNWDIASATTLYAKWTPHKFTVKFNANGGDGSMEDQQFTYDIEQALSANQFTRVGYSFAGWNDKTDGSGTSYTDQQVVKNLTATKDGQKTLYAQWAAIHTITWMVNGSQAEGEPTTSVVNGQTITTLPTTPDVDCNGKVFVGWTTATIHGETATAPDPLYTELGNFPVVTSNMTFNAVFADGEGDEHWVETEINDIEATDEVVIAMQTSDKTYAMYINDDATATPDATDVEPSDLTSASGIATGLIWFIEKDGNGKLIIHPKKDIEKNLYCNPSTDNDRVRVGKSSNNHESYKTFEIDGNYLKNSVTQHYIGVNFTHYRWYGYANNSNFPDQTLKFYKKTIEYTSYTNYSTSCMAGVCDITNANPIYVTSAVGQKIKATDKLVLTTTDMAVGTEISLSAPNITFYKEGAEITQVTTTAATETFELEIAYQPTIANTTEQPTITLEILGYQFAFDNKITGRSLPAKFVIATKAGATWYALPANMNGATNPAALVVEVDETAMTAVAPNTTPYTLWPVKTTSGSGDRFAQYGDRVRFSAVNNEYKGLWANDAKDANTINNYAKIDEVTDDAAEAYEWKITTTVVDGQWQYTLQSDQPNNQNYLGYRMAQDNPAWGTYASSNNLLYFLPITAETTPFDYKVVEWYPNKLLIHTTTAFSSLTAKIAGEQVANVQFTSKDANQYEVTGLPLIENPAKALTLEFVVADATHTGIHTIPVMLSGGNHSVSTLAIGKGIYNYTNLVVRDGATLTIDGATNTDNTFYDVTIYPTAKISVPEGKQLSVHRMTFLGGISEIYNGSTYELNKYGVPQLSLKGNLGKTVTSMDYVMRVDLDQMYQMGVPYDVALSDITYGDGSPIELGTQLYVSAYDGQARANREKKTWIYETDFATKFGSATLKAGVGYTISAEPQTNGDKYAILRMPMKSNISSGSTEAAKTVAVKAYDNEKGVTITDNHKGWNYLSNPYMTTISGGEADTKLVLGYLKETGTGPWEWMNDEIRYVTIPMDNGKDYYQNKFSEAELKPFKSFFLQIAENGDLSFALASRQNAPARLLQQETTPSEIEFELLLSNATQSDNTGLLISEEYTPAYEINADLEKMMSAMSVYTIYNGYNLAYNALSPLNAKEQIPVGYIVPAEGEYTLELDPNSDLDAIKHIYLMDYDMGVTTDLINDAYTFYAADTKSDKRFAINIELSSDIENKPTGFEDVGLEGQRSYKFIYDGILYIMNNGVIYSTTGQQLNTMDK